MRTYRAGGIPVAERTSTAGVAGTRLFWLGVDVDGTADVEVDSATGAITHRYAGPFGTPRGAVPAWSSGNGFLDGPTSTITGLTQLGARLYDPATGAFTTVDPLLDPGSFASRNGYAYAGNSPITNTDPTGECANTNGALDRYTNCAGGHGANADGAEVHQAVAAKGALAKAEAGAADAIPLIAGGWSWKAVAPAVGQAAQKAAPYAGAAAKGFGLFGVLGLILSMSGDTEHSPSEPDAQSPSNTANPDPGDDCDPAPLSAECATLKAESIQLGAPELDAAPDFTDPANSPGEGWEWRGKSEVPGSKNGSWYNPELRQSLNPDLEHADPIGPHYDWKVDDQWYRVFEDGRVVPKP